MTANYGTGTPLPGPTTPDTLDAVTGKRCPNICPDRSWAPTGLIGERCLLMAGHEGMCRVSRDVVHSFHWNQEVVR